MPTGSTRLAFLLVAACLGLAACGGSDNSAESNEPPASTERDVGPATTDAAITTDLEAHIAINPSPAVGAKQRLVVMLPGTGAIPAQYRLILRSGAARGYHTIGLNYPNGQAVGTECLIDNDVDCHGKLRLETIVGENMSPHISVNEANSLLNRLRKLITHLHTVAPNEGWGAFMVNGQPDWARITVAGHSQGGGHAAYLTKMYSLDRAVYFSSPADWRSDVDRPATWITAMPAVTPASRQYGFEHIDDNLVPYSIATGNWRALGLDAFGGVASVDGSASPYGGSHQLSTNATPHNGGGVVISPTHGATVSDDSTPRTGAGTPMFEPVWAYIVFP